MSADETADDEAPRFFPMPDDLDELDDDGIASLAARIWDRFVGRNPDLRNDAGDGPP